MTTTGLQIELSQLIEDDYIAHGIYTFHSVTETSDNGLEICVWNTDDGIGNVSTNKVLQITSDEYINAVHILPLENEEYSIGTDDHRWLLATSNQLYNDTAQTKTLELYSGR
jgi:hypothetical protein